MIRINLMPNAARPKRGQRSDSRLPLRVGIGIVFLSMVVCWVWWGMLAQQRDDLAQERYRKTASLNMLSEQAPSLAILDRKPLSKGKTVEDPTKKFLPIRALSDISHSIDQLELWLVSLTLDRTSMVIDGQALSREDIWQFVNNLERYGVIGRVDGIETRPYNKEEEVRYQFSLQVMVQS